MKRQIRKSHFDNIGPLRFLAFFAIFLSHVYLTKNNQINASKFYSDFKQVVFNLNEAAYSLLFIITGFLNTWGIFEERFIYKKVNILRFYMRRIITLVPLYLVIFFIGFYILPKIQTGFESTETHGIPIWSYLTFTGNYFYNGSGNAVSLVPAIMWSIAVVIQFIFIWPFLMNLFRRHEQLLFASGMIIFLASAWYYQGTKNFQFSFLNILCELMIGGWIAYFSFFKYKIYDYLKRNTTRTILAVYLLFFGFVFFRNSINNEISDLPRFIVFILNRLFLAFIIGYFVFEQNFSNKSLLKLAKLKVFKFPGKIVYGLYAYHMIGILFGYKATLWLNEGKEYAYSLFLLQPIFALSTTFALAILSHEFLEKKFIRRRKDYQPNREYNPIGLKDVKTKSA